MGRGGEVCNPMDYNDAVLSVRDTRQKDIFEVEIDVTSDFSPAEQIEIIEKLDSESVLNTGYLIGCKTFSTDQFGAIGHHCMYLKGYKLNNNKP